MDKESAHSRLLQAIDYLKDNGRARNHGEIAELSNTSRPNVTSAIGGNPRYITEPFLKRFASAYSGYINENWLLTGEGRMEVIDKSMRPHYKATVAAGVLTGEITDVTEEDVEWDPVIKRFPSYDYTIDVAGHSMEPTYTDKGIVACRKLYSKNEIKPGKAYVIATKEGAVLKRIISSTLSSIRVASDNPDPKYKPYSIDKDLIFSIDEVVGSVNVGNPKRKYIDYISDAMVKQMYERLEAGRLSREKFEEEMKEIIRNLAKGVYSDNE